MSDECTLTLRQVDQARGDLYAIADDLEFLKAQIARLAEPGLRQPSRADGPQQRSGR
jgi:hypothetical protein